MQKKLLVIISTLVLISLATVLSGEQTEVQLGLTKDDGLVAGECVFPGDEINYTICFENNNEFCVYNVNLVDYLPDELIYLASSDGGQYCPHQVFWNFTMLDPGEQRCVWLLVEVNSEVLFSTSIL